MKNNNGVTWKDPNSSPQPKRPRSISINSAPTRKCSYKDELIQSKLKYTKSLEEVLNGAIEIEKNGAAVLINNLNEEGNKFEFDGNNFMLHKQKDGTYQKKREFKIKLDNNVANNDTQKTSNFLGTKVITQEENLGMIQLEKMSNNFGNNITNDSSFFSELNTDIFQVISFTIQKISKLNNTLLLHSENSKYAIEGEWLEIRFYVGMKISIFECCCKNSNDKNLNIVDNNNNFLIIEDELITVTSLCSAIKCIYKPIIVGKVLDLNFSYQHSSLVVGVIIHNVIEKCFNLDFNIKIVVQLIKSEIKNNVKLLYSCGIDEKYVIVECMKYVKNILALKEWLTNNTIIAYKNENNNSNINNKFVQNNTQKINKNNEKINFSEKNVIVYCKNNIGNEVEKKIFSLKYGLKGTVDAILQTKNGPLITEIKTGKCIDFSHKAQTLLYYLILKDKMYGLCNEMLLYYAHEGLYMKITPKHNELMQVLIKRNIIASMRWSLKNNCQDIYNIASDKFIADCKCSDENFCKKISWMNKTINNYHINNVKDCTYLKKDKIREVDIELQTNVYNFENRKGTTNMNDKETIDTNHKQVSDEIEIKEIKCNLLLNKSVQHDKLTKHEQKTILKNNNVFIDKGCGNKKHFEYEDEFKISKINLQYNSTLKKQKSDQLKIEDKIDLGNNCTLNGMTENNFNDGKNNYKDHEDYLIASWMKSQWNGINEEENNERNEKKLLTYFVNQEKNILTVSIEEQYIETLNNLRDFIDICNNKGIKLSLGKIVEIQQNNIIINLREDISMQSYYKIYIVNTRGEYFFKTMRYALLNVHLNRNLILKILQKNLLVNTNILDTYTKNYKDTNSLEKISNDNDFTLSIPPLFRDEFMKLNDDQRSALYLSLNCKEYRLIHGFPGTGKTTVLVLLIKILAYLKKKILLICYTNLALENILKKLKLRYHRAGKENNAFESVSKMREYFNNIELVAGTCYSFRDEVFINRNFDFCIIDEASQQHLLLTLIPISLCERFILVGDHLQLKPLTRKSKVLKISLFEELYEDASELKRQYRMGDRIMQIPNKMFYNSKMIGNGKFGQIEFIDSNSIIINEFIKKVLHQRKILNKGINNTLVILCYFNSSVTEIKKLVGNELRVETVDRFQGSEANEIILYLNPVFDNEIMNSRERLNVALTRAMHSLTIFGDEKNLSEIEVFREMFQLFRKYNYI